MNRALLFAIILLSACSETDIYTTQDVDKYCTSIKGSHIDYESLLDRFQHVHLDTSHQAGLINLNIIAEGDIGGLDTCWHIITYNHKKERITDCSRACQ